MSTRPGEVTDLDTPTAAMIRRALDERITQRIAELDNLRTQLGPESRCPTVVDVARTVKLLGCRMSDLIGVE